MILIMTGVFFNCKENVIENIGLEPFDIEMQVFNKFHTDLFVLNLRLHIFRQLNTKRRPLSHNRILYKYLPTMIVLNNPFGE